MDITFRLATLLDIDQFAPLVHNTLTAVSSPYYTQAQIDVWWTHELTEKTVFGGILTTRTSGSQR